MTSRVIVASPETTVGDAARLLRGYTIGCVPIVDGKELVGIVTTSDLLDLLAEKPRRRSGPERPLIRS
jgi:acetoin utilization protein AcuB